MSRTVPEPPAAELAVNPVAPDPVEPADPLPVAPPPEPPSTTVVVTLEGAPAGALVFIGDREVGPADQPFSLDRGDATVTLEIVAEGYERSAVAVVPVADLSLPVSLEAEVKQGKTKKTKKTQDTQDSGKVDKELGF
jgi:hypothetical protein